MNLLFWRKRAVLETHRPWEYPPYEEPIKPTGSIVGPWEFPEPELQAEADLRRQIADLTAKVFQLNAQLAGIELRELECISQKARLQHLEALAQRKIDEVNESIERTTGIRTASLQAALNKARFELAQLRPLNRKK